ncbi:MAG: lysophospholipid acyltransferase family protein [Candidatus Omnitrophica bacterium]|jgi:KDO2-lipid IV(A) lauroyltransferase|nr:lysophospholipid acyltransferase family protein [Candidatus Omnitrophota bacterium]
MNKELQKTLARRAGWFFLRIFTVVNGSFSLKWSYALGRRLGSFACAVIPQQRKISTDSLAIAFPDMTLKERKKITRDFFVFMAQSGFELLYFLRHLDRMQGVKIEGRQNLDEALKAGTGIILVTAHMGNFPLMSLKLAREGYKINFVTRPMRDEKAGDYLFNLRENAGVKSIFSYPRKECISGILKALRNNEIVIMQMDQNFGSGGVWVKFFGKLAATPVGPITLGMRTKAKLVPAYIYREGLSRHCIKILPAEPIIEAENKDEAVLKNAAKFSRIIESWIKEYPEQWGWIHRRWKSQPPKDLAASQFKVEV